MPSWCAQRQVDCNYRYLKINFCNFLCYVLEGVIKMSNLGYSDLESHQLQWAVVGISLL